MKSILKKLSIVIFIALFTTKFIAQTLEESLTAAFQQIDTSKTIGEMMSAAAKFDIITNSKLDFSLGLPVHTFISPFTIDPHKKIQPVTHFNPLSFMIFCTFDNV